jgi:hypothetical protein
MTQLKEAPPTGFHIFSGAHELGAVTDEARANDTQDEASRMLKAALLTSRHSCTAPVPVSVPRSKPISGSIR